MTICYLLHNDVLYQEKYTIPLHTLQGGSATLIKMLNQLGLCASADTLARYIQHKSINKETAMNCCLNSDSFTVVSADNIDFLHSYARVYKGSKNSSWHGLSIQVDQPLPSLSIESETDHSFSKDVYLSSNSENVHSNLVDRSLEYDPGVTNMDDAVTLKRCRGVLLPTMSPHKGIHSPATKKKRLPRTGTEHSTDCGKNKSTHSLVSTSHTAYVHAKGNKSQLDFLTNDQEIKVYMQLKTAFANKRPDSIFISLQDYFSCIRASHTEKSKCFLPQDHGC